MPKVQDFPWTHEQVMDICRDNPTPFHIYDERAIRKTVQDLYKAFSWSPNFKNYFAVKATPNPYILQILKEEGCGADCSSVTELLLSEKMGLKAEEIMFTSNCTPLKEYKKAKELGAVINLDDITHINFLNKEVGMPDLISFRFNPGPERTGNVLIGDPKSAKFGLTKAQLFEAYAKCKAMGVKRFALHTMVVSNCLKVEELVETARMLFTLVKEINEQVGIQIETVNLGGGIGIPYRPNESVIDVAAVGAGIKNVYEELIVEKGLPPVRIVMECGRYITGPSGFLFTRCIHRKRIYKNYVGVDACMANLMRPGMYDAYHHISVFQNNEQMPSLPARTDELPDNTKDLINGKDVFDVVGGLCENNDKFAVDRHLDTVPEPGDVLVLHDTGAHGHSMGFNYNGKPRSAEYLYREDGTVLQIRRQETVDDLWATLDFGGLPFFTAPQGPMKTLADFGFVGKSAREKRQAVLMGVGAVAMILGLAMLRSRK